MRFTQPPGYKGYDPNDFEYGEKSTLYSLCDHKPKEILKGKKGSVWAASERGLPEVSPEGFDLYLNFSGYDVYPGLDRKVHWENYSSPDVSSKFWRDFWAWIEKGNKVLIYCQGAHGRTGTALACLFVASEGIGGEEAVEKVRELHCVKAVESETQKAYVVKVANELNKPKEAATT